MQKILRRFEGDDSIQVTDVSSKPATSKGDNYSSDMVRVLVEFSRNTGNRKSTEKRSVIIKVAPTSDGPRKDLIQKSKIFQTEMSMLKNTLEKMNKFLDPAHRLSGHVLHLQEEDPTLLVLEDLGVLGFRMADRQAGLDLEHCLLAIRGLARFHASSVALCEKEPQQKEMYNRGIFSFEYPEEFRSFFTASLGIFADEVETWPDFGKKYADKLRKLSTCVYAKGVEVLQLKEDDFNVINHGDSWVNNMLFKYNNEGRPEKHIFVDFQMCVYTSPAIDLHYFISTSACEDVYENHIDTLIEEYHRTVCSTMKQIGCTTPTPSLAKIKQMMKERALYGMFAALTVLPVVVCEDDNLRDLDEFLDTKEGYDLPMFKSKTYHRLMVKRLPMYDKMGLLDL